MPGTGPLRGIRVVEIASLGPGPFCAMMLADMGADVMRIDRPDAEASPHDPLLRSRDALAVDLKGASGVDLVLELVDRADVLIEGFRPGVMERLGLGPDECQTRNPKLVYGRMTGWGQVGGRAQTAGHDIDYIAVAGALWPIGARGTPPPPPLNMVGDFGGGGLLLAFGVVAALVERQASGLGQVIDAAMTDGSALLTAMLHGHRAAGAWSDERGANLLDGGAPFYRTYETADGGFMAVGAIEPQFYAEFVDRLGVDLELADQFDRATWQDTTDRIAARFRDRSRAEWANVFDGTDACVAPVLSPAEAASDVHLLDRNTFVEVAGHPQPAPAPRFSRSGATHPTLGGTADPVARLGEWGITRSKIDELRAAGTIT